jgi:hypothetical protein
VVLSVYGGAIFCDDGVFFGGAFCDDAIFSLPIIFVPLT